MIKKRSLLREARAKYLSYGSGPIEGLKTGGIIWRVKYIPRFRRFNILVINPIDAQKTRTDLSPQEYGELTGTLLKSGWYKDYTFVVGDLEEANLSYVKSADFLIAFLPNSRLSIGTATEIRMAWQKKIPIFLVCPRSRLYKLESSWYKRWLLLGSLRFDSFEDLFSFLQKHKNNLSGERLKILFGRAHKRQWSDERRRYLPPEIAALLNRAVKKIKQVRKKKN